jgi:N-acetylglutamate synthase-like GNAT family acetyltransferase
MAKSNLAKNTSLLSPLNAKQFLKRLELLRPLQSNSGASNEMGVPKGKVFALAKEFMSMPVDEIEKLLESPFHEARVGVVGIMDFEARNKKTPNTRRKELFDLYIHRHDLITTWDLVDRSAPYVVGGYLFDKSREILYELARSTNMAERRTAIVSTYFFIRQNDLDDTFKIAELLVNDNDKMIQMAVGGWIREAGKKDVQKLLSFLEKYAATMPRVTLRYAIEHLDRAKKELYMNMGKKKAK